MNPETFERELNTRCAIGDSTYRLRWSPARETWMVEQRVARPTDIPGDGEDATIRLRDGYALVTEVAPRPFMKCPTCHLPLAVPELKVGEVKCAYCYPRPENGHPIFFVGYYPLCDRLLTQLEKTSPKRHTEWVKEMREKNERNAALRKRAVDNEYEAGLLDVHDFALGKVGTSKLGYTTPGSPHSFGGVF